MNESQKDIEKAHEATVSLQGIAAAIEREREVLGRADSDPRGDDSAPMESTGDGSPDPQAEHEHDGTGVEEALRLFPLPVQNPR